MPFTVAPALGTLACHGLERWLIADDKGHTLPYDADAELYDTKELADRVAAVLNEQFGSPRAWMAYQLFAVAGQRGEQEPAAAVADAEAFDPGTPDEVDTESATVEIPVPVIPPDLTHALSELVMLFGPELVKLAAAKY